MDGERLTLAVGDQAEVSAIFDRPDRFRACYVFAHGAGAGMTHPFMTSVAAELAQHGVAVFRYNFPYMEARRGRPDHPALAQATVRAAVGEASRLAPGVPLFAGGKSFGGRMTSQAQAAAPLAGVRGLVFFGFPLHPPGKPSDERAAHLDNVAIPMLFLQGSHDKLAELDLLKPLCKRLGDRATLRVFDDADHSFHVPKSSGRNDAEVRRAMISAVATWIASLP
jgi:uncharacterized protein